MQTHKTFVSEMTLAENWSWACLLYSRCYQRKEQIHALKSVHALTLILFYKAAAQQNSTVQSGSSWFSCGGSKIHMRFKLHLSVLLMASPNPGVSIMESLSLIPFSSMLTVCLTMPTVWSMRSEETCTNKGWSKAKDSFFIIRTFMYTKMNDCRYYLVH